MTVAIIGAGVMGETLLSGLIRGGRPVGELMVGEKRAERAAELRDKYGVTVVPKVAGISGGITAFAVGGTMIAEVAGTTAGATTVNQGGTVGSTLIVDGGTTAGSTGIMPPSYHFQVRAGSAPRAGNW